MHKVLSGNQKVISTHITEMYTLITVFRYSGEQVKRKYLTLKQAKIIKPYGQDFKTGIG